MCIKFHMKTSNFFPSSTAFLLNKNGSLFSISLWDQHEENLALSMTCLFSRTITWMQAGLFPLSHVDFFSFSFFPNDCFFVALDSSIFFPTSGSELTVVSWKQPLINSLSGHASLSLWSKPDVRGAVSNSATFLPRASVIALHFLNFVTQNSPNFCRIRVESSLASSNLRPHMEWHAHNRQQRAYVQWKRDGFHHVWRFLFCLSVSE